MQIKAKHFANMPTQLKEQAKAKRQIDDQCVTSCYTEIHKHDWVKIADRIKKAIADRLN